MTDIELKELLEKATPGDWHHVQPFMTIPAQMTVHGKVPAERVDYVSTWNGPGTPDGHRVVIAMEGREQGVRSEDMALIAAMKCALPDLLSRVSRYEEALKTIEGTKLPQDAHPTTQHQATRAAAKGFQRLARQALEPRS